MDYKTKARARKGSFSIKVFEKECERRNKRPVSLTKERLGEIALEVVRHKIRQDGIMLSLDNMRGFEVTARVNHLNGVLVKELREFVRVLTQEFLDEIIPRQ